MSNIDDAKVYCLKDENCGGFFDKGRTGKLFIPCYQPVNLTTARVATMLYTKTGKFFMVLLFL